jgi:hypothetical protein
LLIQQLVRILEAGEAAAIGLCHELQADLLLCDDLEARRVAVAEGLRVVGTLGLLVRGKRAGLLDAVGPILNAMLVLGFRVSPDLVDETLRLAGGELTPRPRIDDRPARARRCPRHTPTVRAQRPV